MGTALDRKRTITALNDLLRGELSAVETYDMALPLLINDRMALADLRACRSSHQDRVDLLRDAVVKAGGDPVDSSGAWGAFARAVEGSASALGSSSLAVKTLEKGEEHGLREYEELLPRLETEWRTVISKEALPEPFAGASARHAAHQCDAGGPGWPSSATDDSKCSRLTGFFTTGTQAGPARGSDVEIRTGMSARAGVARSAR